MTSQYKPNRTLFVLLCISGSLLCALYTAASSFALEQNATSNQRIVAEAPPATTKVVAAKAPTPTAAKSAPLAKRPPRLIVDDAFEAYGGVEKVKRARDRSYVAKGKVTVISGISGGANSFDCIIWGKKDRMRVETMVLGQKSISGYDGTVSWSQTGDWVSKNSATATHRIAEEVKHGFESLLDSLAAGADIESLPPRTVSGDPCEVVRINYKEGPTTIFFDPVSHLVSRSEFAGDDPEQGHTVVKGFEYSDYRPVEGIPTPYITAEYSGDKKIAQTILDSIAVSKEVADSVFAMPPESSVAALKEGPVTIPFRYSENEILINVRIKDKEYPFLVDTGASTSVIDKRVAHSLGHGEAATFTITAGGQSLPLTYMTVPAITMGSITLDSISALVTDLSALGLGVKQMPSGIIGANVLKRFLVTFDYPGNKLLLSDPQVVSLPDDAVAIATTPAFGSTAIVVPGKLNGEKTVNFLVDTGAAFNNLPPALAQDFYTGKLLQVGKIAGMDGKPIKMCSLQLDSLQLGSLNIDKPVFATVPSGTAPAGLVNASSMGILGNPLWSQYKVTLDYRNECLIIQPPPGKKLLDETTSSLEKIHRQFLRDKKLDVAAAAYDEVAAGARAAGSKASEALAVSYVAGLNSERYKRDSDVKWIHQGVDEFRQAAELAKQSKNPRVEARVLAGWALIYIAHEELMSNPKYPHFLPEARDMLVRATELDPLEPTVYAVLGKASQQVGKNLIAEKLIDQALLLDPDNWLALWTKLLILQQLDQSEVPLVVAQMQRYYGDVPEVAALKTTVHKSPGSTP
jgi:predicted aspartyl protease